MTAFFLLFTLVGVGLFYCQNLALFTQVHLRLPDLFLTAVGVRAPLPLAFALAVALGIVQDSFAGTPFGLHLLASLALVAVCRFLRRRFLLQRMVPQVAVALATLGLQEVALRLTLFLTGTRNFLFGDLAVYRGMEILATAALAPLMFALLKGLEKAMSRWGWRGMSSAG